MQMNLIMCGELLTSFFFSTRPRSSPASYFDRPQSEGNRRLNVSVWRENFVRHLRSSTCMEF